MLRSTTSIAAPTAAASPVLRLTPTSRSNLRAGAGRVVEGLERIDELPRTLASAALKDAAGLGYERLVLDGGEPFLYAGLAGLLTRARRLDLETTIVTNGTLLHQERRWAPVAPLLDRLVVSLHGLGATHDAAVGRDGAFDQAVENLELVRSAAVSLGLRLTLTTENLTEALDVVRLAAREGATSVELQTTFEGGVSDEVLASAAREAVAVGAELGVQIITDLVDQDQLMLYRGEFVPATRSRHLTEVAPTLVIEADGRVRPLTTDLPMRLMLGSLHRHRLAAIAPAWLASPRAAEIATVCDRVWWELVTPGGPSAVRWLGELALNVTDAPPAPVAAAPLAMAA